jgi:hypothetical protein
MDKGLGCEFWGGTETAFGCSIVELKSNLFSGVGFRVSGAGFREGASALARS